jgi:hypothetical protein
MRVALLAAGALVLAVGAGCTSAGEQTTDGTAAPSPGASSAPAQELEPVGKPNGVETLGPKRVLDRAGRAAMNARSVRIVGSGPDASLDLVVTEDSGDGTRTAGEVTLRTRVADGNIYIRADESYWTEAFNKKKAARIGDKWVVGDLDNPRLKTFKRTSTMKPLIRQFLRTAGEAEVGEVGGVRGQPAVPVTSESGTLWIATTGKPYPLLLSSPAADQSSEVTFRKWDKKVVIKAPPRKNTISLADLA